MTYALAPRRGGAASVTANHRGNGGRSRDTASGSRCCTNRPCPRRRRGKRRAIPDVLVGIRSRAAGSPLILCGGEIVVVMAAMPAQRPYDAEIISVASRTWPDAATAFNRHRSHTIVVPLGSGENKFWRAPPPPWSAV
jgi:hypothetical protein